MKKINLKNCIGIFMCISFFGILNAQYNVNSPATNPIPLTGISTNIKNRIEMCGQYANTHSANSFVSIVATEEQVGAVLEVHLYSSINQLWTGFPASYAVVTHHIIPNARNPHVCYSGDNSFYLIYESTVGSLDIIIDRFDYNTTTGVINTTSLTYPVAFPQAIPGSSGGINPRVCEKNYKHVPSIVYEIGGDIIYATLRTPPSGPGPFGWITQSLKSAIANNTTNPHMRNDMEDHSEVSYFCDPNLYLNVETFSHPDISNDYHISYVAQNANTSTDYVNVIKLIPRLSDPNAAVNFQFPNAQISYHDISSFFNAPSSGTNAYRYPEIAASWARTDDFGATSFSPGVSNPNHLCLDRYAVVYEEFLSLTNIFVKHFGRQSYSEDILHAHRNSFVLQFGGCPPEDPDCWDIDQHIYAIINNMDCQVKIPVNQINEDQQASIPLYEGVDIAQSIWTNNVNFPGDANAISNNFINGGRKPMFLGTPPSYYGAPDPGSVVSMSGGTGGPFFYPTIGANAFVPITHFALNNTAAITPKRTALLNLSDPHHVYMDASAHAMLTSTEDIFIKTKEFDNSNPLLPRLKQLNSITKKDFSIFPNPVSSGFILKSAGTIGSPMQMEITDMMGRLVYFIDFIYKGNNGFEIAELGKGLYNIKLTNEGQVNHIKLVKE